MIEIEERWNARNARPGSQLSARHLLRRHPQVLISKTLILRPSKAAETIDDLRSRGGLGQEQDERAVFEALVPSETVAIWDKPHELVSDVLGWLHIVGAGSHSWSERMETA